MTPDTPDSADLLRAAMDVLKKDLLSSLPEAAKLDALMVLSVMASAERDLRDFQSKSSLTERQAQRLHGLGGKALDAKTLCDSIRTGLFDSPDRAAELTAVLMDDVRDRLSLVNPKYLALADQEPGDSL